MTIDLKRIEEQLATGSEKRPLGQWHPPLSGDIAIVIDSEGCWLHEGRVIQREALVKLFASILRREADGEYYLVTPVEKWRIEVADAPLLVVDIELKAGEQGADIYAETNTGSLVRVDSEHPLYMAESPQGQRQPYLLCDFDLPARLTRAAWYRLVEQALDAQNGENGAGETITVHSAGSVFELG